MYEREIHKWTDEGKPISPAFGQNYGSIKCSLKEKTNNLVASQPQDIVILNRQHRNNVCYLSVICVEIQRTRIKRVKYLDFLDAVSLLREETISLVVEYF